MGNWLLLLYRACRRERYSIDRDCLQFWDRQRLQKPRYGDYCKIEVRTQAGQVRQIITVCAQDDYCSGVQNFGDVDNTIPFIPEPSRSDECKPTTYSTGNTFML